MQPTDTSQSRVDLIGTWRLALRLLGQRPLIAVLLVPAIVFAAYAANKASEFVPDIDLSSSLPAVYYHLIVIARAVAVCLIAVSFALPRLATDGSIPGRNWRRSWMNFIGRTIVAVSITVGLVEILVSPQDLGNATLGLFYDTSASPLSLLFDIPALIVLHAGLAAATLVGVPDALWMRKRQRVSNEGPHLFLVCLLPFGTAVIAEIAVFLLVPVSIVLSSYLPIVASFDTAAMFFAVLLSFANHRRYVSDEAAAVFD